MPTPPVCSECGSTIGGSTRDGLCPRCLIGLALEKVAEAKPGETCGDYELIEKIGEGGMGVVYKARQKTLNRVVALKLIRAGAHATGEEVRRFRGEAKAAAALQHPNIVAIHEVGEHAGQHFFSMEYIEGRNLSYLIRRTTVPAGRAAQTVQTIAEAIHYAHGRGVLHRDLKPHNILIDAQGEPRITDFGLAQHSEGEAAPTLTGAVLGTPSYMPPEQAAGKRWELGPASDVYSLGAILYDLLTGRPPFRADTPLDTLRQVIDTEPVAPRLLSPKIPRDLETICLKCLAKTPGQRYPSAQELAEELGRFLRHEPILARPVGRVGRWWRWARRKPALAGMVGGAGLMFLLLAAGGFGFRTVTGGLIYLAAQNEAQVLAASVDRLKAEVASVSRNADLPRLLRSPDREAGYAFLQREDQRIRGAGLTWMNAKPFESWSLFDAEGFLIARFPPLAVKWPDFSFANRDHNRGARTSYPGAYVSKVFRSLTDPDDVDKFAVSIAVRDGEGAAAPLVGVVLATVTTHSTLTLSRSQKFANIVIYGPTDPSDRPDVLQGQAILSHPAYDDGSKAIRVEDSAMALGAGISGFYLDPVRREYPRYQGPWIASEAPIDGTPFHVIVQVFDYFTNAWVIPLAAGLVAALVFMIRRRTRSPR